MRLSLAAEHADELKQCLAFFQRVQQTLHNNFVHPRQHLRVLRTVEEKQLWPRRAADPRLQHFLSVNPPALDPERFLMRAQDGFQMRHGGWVDTAAYLSASREVWQQLGRWCGQKLAFENLQSNTTGWTWQGQHYAWIIDCRGWSAAQGKTWDWLPWDCAKGTILTLAADLGREQRILHHGCWLVPRRDGTLRVGSTYDKDLRQPYAAAPGQVDLLEHQLRATLRVPWTIHTESTAVRPILQGQRIVIGIHPARERWAILNGLGSKGALRAPSLANHLLNHLLEGHALPAAWDVRRNL
jgi:hypothetical protein